MKITAQEYDILVDIAKAGSIEMGETKIIKSLVQKGLLNCNTNSFKDGYVDEKTGQEVYTGISYRITYNLNKSGWETILKKRPIELK